MEQNHNHSVTLEHIVSEVFSCDRYGMGGYINSDHFDSEPFDAALFVVSKLWHKDVVNEIENELEKFMAKWEQTFRDKKIMKKDIDIDLYIKELRNIIEILK